MSHTSLDRLVHDLLALEREPIDLGRVFEMIADPVLDAETITRHAHFRDDRYTRTPIHRSEHFDVMVLGWMPGQRTPIHDHSGQCGWVRLVQGRIEEEAFAHAPGTVHPDPGSIGFDEDGVGHEVDLLPTTYTLVAEPGAVVAVDRVRAIHRLGNPRQHHDDERTVTLHVYSRPHDSCLVFDPDGRRCWRKELSFD